MARIAIRSKIEGEEVAEEAIESSPKRNVISVEIPRAIFDVMEDSIRRGEYTSFQTAIEELVRGRFLSRETSAALNAEVQQRSAKTIDVM